MWRIVGTPVDDLASKARSHDLPVDSRRGEAPVPQWNRRVGIARIFGGKMPISLPNFWFSWR
ncbi:hypothetical protein [Shinella sp.]|uniref:hypothetical protein n=1 Tax=Shinella sp. TaxID=1870904 RepID=UPI0039E2577C